MKLWKRMFLILLTAALMVPSALACQHTEPEPVPYETAEWAAGEVTQAAALGLVNTEFDSFDLRVPITRNEFRKLAMTFLHVQTQLACLEDMVSFSLAEKDETGESKLVFHDKPDEPDRQTDRENSTAYYLGVVKGRGNGIFAPDDPITREEAAVLLDRAYQVIGGSLPAAEGIPFSDWEAISPYARDSAAALNAWGVMKGTDGERFDPKGQFTREQCVLTFLRLYENAPVSRTKNNVPQLFSYEEIMARYDACYSGDNAGSGQIARGQLGRWEGPKATAIHDALQGVTITPASTFFVYQDGRVRYFDIGLCTVWEMLTSSVELKDGHFSEDGNTFFCTAVFQSDNQFHKAGLYHISVDVETLEVQQQWEPLP